MKPIFENWKKFLNEQQELESILDNWEHEDAANYAKVLIEKYGEPDEYSENQMTWRDISQFDETVVKDESVPHDSPKPHRDFVYSTIELEVPEELVQTFAAASESILIDRLKNTVTARCGDIEANAITLGFVQDVVRGEEPSDPEEAKEEYNGRILKGILPSWFKHDQMTEEETRDTYGSEVVDRNEKERERQRKLMGLDEKDDRCTRIAKRKYDVWPSAYASGAVVKCRQGKIWKDVKEGDDSEGLRKWFGRKGEPGSKGGWVDCNAPKYKDGKKIGYKACGRGEGEERSKYPACRPTAAQCKQKGKGKKWGKKGSKKESLEMNFTDQQIDEAIRETFNDMAYYHISDAIFEDGSQANVEFWDDVIEEAEYQGRKVTLNKPMQGDVKKFKVYVKDPKTGNVKKVNFGDPNMRIKKSNPARRKSFRARHNCDNPGPKTKARYWSCKKW